MTLSRRQIHVLQSQLEIHINRLKPPKQLNVPMFSRIAGHTFDRCDVSVDTLDREPRPNRHKCK